MSAKSHGLRHLLRPVDLLASASGTGRTHFMLASQT
jgi:hypothetical protein